MADPASADQILDAAVQAGAAPTSLGGDAVLDTATNVVTSHRAPGEPVVTAADAAALAAQTAEAASHVDVGIYEAPLVVPTNTPEANLAARANIVSDGAGTVGHIGS